MSSLVTRIGFGDNHAEKSRHTDKGRLKLYLRSYRQLGQIDNSLMACLQDTIRYDMMLYIYERCMAQKREN